MTKTIKKQLSKKETKQELNFTQAETALYKNLPKQLTTLVDYFFPNQQNQSF